VTVLGASGDGGATDEESDLTDFYPFRVNSWPSADPLVTSVGGTSEATPMFSGVVAVADQAAGHDLGQLNPTLYAHGGGPFSGLTDITRGNNSVTFPQGGQTITVNGFNAVPGYDLASGLGTPDGPRLVAELARGRHGFAR
jgi:subtilase family serine protease